MNLTSAAARFIGSENLLRLEANRGHEPGIPLTRPSAVALHRRDKSGTLPLKRTERGSAIRSNFVRHIVDETNGNAFESGACCGSQSRAPVQGFKARILRGNLSPALPTRASRGEGELRLHRIGMRWTCNKLGCTRGGNGLKL